MKRDWNKMEAGLEDFCLESRLLLADLTAQGETLRCALPKEAQPATKQYHETLLKQVELLIRQLENVSSVLVDQGKTMEGETTELESPED